MRWWLRFQFAASLMAVVNFCLLAITAAPAIGRFTGLDSRLVCAMLPPLAILAVVGVGTVLDWCHYAQRLDREATARSGAWGRLFDQLDRIEVGSADAAEGRRLLRALVEAGWENTGAGLRSAVLAWMGGER
jgi:hypothetical protein